MNEKNHLLQHISELMASETLVPFIGAGFSFPAGCPTWRDLTDSLLAIAFGEADRSISVGLRARLADPDLAELLDSLTISDYEIRRQLRDRIDSARLSVHAYHRSLASLGCPIIVTTNWDTLIERSYREAQVPYQVIYRDEDISLFDPTRRVQIIKLHGTIENLSSLVFKKGQYDAYWRDRPLLGALLTTLAATKSFLFLGYGFGDPNILSQLYKISEWSKCTGRDHYALIYQHTAMSNYWKSLAINCITASHFDSRLKNYDAATLQFIDEISRAAHRATMSNLDRAKLINQEIRRVINRREMGSVLRMRGALGWLSNPNPDKDDPVYGDIVQDLAERDMTDLLCELLDKCRGSRVDNILHLRASPLLATYKPTQLLRRFKTIKEMLSRYKGRISVTHDEFPSRFNHMIMDDMASIVGFKVAGFPGIPRVVSTRDRSKIADEITQFDRDRDALAASNKTEARLLGIDIDQGGWGHDYAITLIDSEIEMLERAVASAPEAGSGGPHSGVEALASALIFAVLRHSKARQTREDQLTPYGVHLVRVIEWLRRVGKVDDTEILMAAALHDVVEDCGVTVSELAKSYGNRVAMIVGELSQGPAQSADEYVHQIASASGEAKTIKLADRFDNVRDLDLMRSKRFGGLVRSEYLVQSEALLAVCRTANLALAQALHEQIDSTKNAFSRNKNRKKKMTVPKASRERRRQRKSKSSRSRR